MRMGLYVGLDIGTTSTKVFAYDEQGNIRGSGQSGYSLLVPEPGRAEQRPDDIVRAVTEAFRLAKIASGAKAGDIAAVGVSTAMHSLMAVDGDGHPLTPLVTWADNRSAPQIGELKRRGLDQRLYELTGTPVHPMSPLGKLLWWRENQPEMFAKAAKFISIKEYVFHRFFGTYALDISLAAATGLLRVEGDDWCEEALEIAGVGRERLGELMPVTQVLRGMRPEAAERCGLLPETPWIVGGSDGALANIGSGAADYRSTAVTIGTSGAVRRFAPKPVTDPQGRTFCYAFGQDRWLIGGPTNNGGIALRWFKEQFMPPEPPAGAGSGAGLPAQDRRQHRGRQRSGPVRTQAAPSVSRGSFDELIEQALSVPPGAEGLLFLPYLSGERAPHWDPSARGVFAGAGLHHERRHFARAVLEGVLLAVDSVTSALAELAGPPERLLASGGFAASPGWTGLLADISGVRIDVPDTYEASARGAAILAMLGMGAITSLDELGGELPILRSHLPDERRRAVYERVKPVFRRLYDRLEPVFPELAALQTAPDAQRPARG
ncbi:gluconokinase [Paenibacillus spiritus]|uniref:Gluconokinase n=1 Tax=Paenibacillus spiritus TaxID=2496557 RepID=A0A5J5FWR3_9BACL|nr:gluconokinase [Paenibacillus spiritus]KAA8998381.1 gluconokinase [Paenibacillus spiritus]